MSLLLLLRHRGSGDGTGADLFPKTLTVHDYGHAATVRERFTIAVYDCGHTASARER